MDNGAMYKINYGLFLLSAKDEFKDNACIINTVQQVTTSPNRIAITINKDNFTHNIIVKSGEFNVSILTEKTPFDLFKHFGFQSGKTVDKFKDYPNTSRSENGLIYLPNFSNAFISGKTVSSFDLGTHTMFVADVVDAKIISQENSLGYEYYHKNIKPQAPKSEVKGWRCKICGYVYEGENLPEDFICPICKHGAIDFERI